MRKDRLVALGFLATIAAACGSSGSNGGGNSGGGTGNGTCADGGPGSCTGCCDNDNVCQAGNEDMTCGTAGGPCESCSTVGLACVAGACGTGTSSGGPGTEAGTSSGGSSSGAVLDGGPTRCSGRRCASCAPASICCLPTGMCGCTTAGGACI